jgi:cardiolipin synthase (CMP-forming)
MNDNEIPSKLTLATKITILRIMMTPVFVLLAVYYMDSVMDKKEAGVLRLLAGLVFLVCCATDALDGYLARSRNERTRLGTLLDPLADKVLLLTGLLVLTGPWGRKCFEPYIPVWYVLLVISRDLFLTLGAVIIHVMVGRMVVKPRLVGKASTFFQMAIIGWVLIGLPEEQFRWLLWIGAGFTLISTFQYLVDGVRQLKAAEVHKTPPDTP